MGLEMVTQDPGEKLVLYRNPKVMDRVYFVGRVDIVPDRAETIRRLMQPTFAWDSTAIVDQSLPGPAQTDSAQRATITEYIPHDVKITASTPVPTLLVLSDAEYPPGWTALDNGNVTPIYKVNGYVRGVYLTPGEHQIEYRYTGKYEKAGVAVATTSYFIVCGLVIGSYFFHRRKKREKASA
jgi:hypothetical protein